MGKREKLYRITIFVLLIAFFISQAPYNIQAAVKCKSVSLNVTKATISVGEVLPLTAITKPLNATGKQKWSSSNKKIATVTQYGAVTGIKEGTATITIKINGKKAKCNVTVVNYATKKDIANINSNDNKVEVQSYLKDYVTKSDLSAYYQKKDIYTKAEVNSIVSKKTSGVKSEDLSSYSLKKDVYTKEEVDKLLSNGINSIEQPDLTKYSEKKDVYTKAEVNKIVSDGIDGIEQPDLTKYSEKKDVYTKEEVDKLISDALEKVVTNNEWDDGKELLMDSDSLKLPYEKSLNGNCYINLENIQIKKYHNTNISASTSCYKYNIIISGQSQSNNIDEYNISVWPDVVLYLYDSSGTGYVPVNIRAISDENNNFSIEKTFDNIFIDADKFCIMDVNDAY